MIQPIAFIIGASLLLLNFSCGPKGSRAGVNIYKNEWVISGKVMNESFASGKVMAIGLDGTRFSSNIGKDSSFVIGLPGNSTLALYFIPAQAQEGKNSTASMLNFEESPDVGVSNSLRLPHVIFDHNLSLGEVDIKNDQAFPTLNPAASLDFDTDGIPDSLDRDDQNDGLNDLEQKRVLERVNLCHLTSSSSGETKTIPLADMFTHIDHGDVVGPCHYLTPKAQEQP